MAAASAGPLKGSKGVDEQENVRILGADAAVVISRSGILLAGETELPAERVRRAAWVLSKREGTWVIEAYINCPTKMG